MKNTLATSRQYIGIVCAAIFILLMVGLEIDSRYFQLWGRGEENISGWILVALGVPFNIIGIPMGLSALISIF